MSQICEHEIDWGLRPVYLLNTSNSGEWRSRRMDRVLAIEDDPAVQRALRRTFESAGFEITVASDGASAMDVFRSTAPRVVILDLRLPGRSGQDICREIKRQSPGVP